jgi:hypothetical protein
MSTPEQFTPVVGGYYMQRGGLVRIDSVSPSGEMFSTVYIQIRDGAVTNGGSSAWWPASDYTPITDPRLYAAAKVFEAQREAHDHRVLGSRAETRAQQWLFAMEAISEASKAVGSAS